MAQGKKYFRIMRFGFFAFAALIVGAFAAVQRHDSSTSHSVLLDFETNTASADTPDSGTGTADSGSSDSGSSDSGSGDSGSGCGSGDSGSGDSGDGCGGDGG